jgi:hypothetical protein
MVAAIWLFAQSDPLQAQVSVQVPVVRGIAGAGVVTVPDRGGVLFGGAGRAAESRWTGGPAGSCWPRGSAIGREHSSTSLSTHVFIHDLREMDEAVLAEAERRQPGPTPVLSTGAAAAWHGLTAGRSRTSARPEPSSLQDRASVPGSSRYSVRRPAVDELSPLSRINRSASVRRY